ncbi:MAG: prepilin-type N-terminal cleavage/methylation domain-containing protein [bacterium]|jgi:prepilin-type N-terminal cleavage/methylation domain-containing protein|nr:prepilin-type N-terminal cleavage/methylation domain-containing protein [bacterium]
MKSHKSTGFTLIELLIVVAIIGILAAIAVPNFMNAQIRAKVARCYSDMRSLSTSIAIFNTEKGKMLVDIRDDDNTAGMERIDKYYNGVGANGGAGNRNNLAVLSPLTSPISYMSSIPKSPFVPSNQMTSTTGNNEAWGREGNDAYVYWDNDPEFPDGEQDWNVAFLGRYIPNFKPWDYILISFGPGANSDDTTTSGMPYNPSNGMVSKGEIFLTNGGLNNENAQDKGV